MQGGGEERVKKNKGSNTEIAMMACLPPSHPRSICNLILFLNTGRLRKRKPNLVMTMPVACRNDSIKIGCSKFRIRLRWSSITGDFHEVSLTNAVISTTIDMQYIFLCFYACSW